MGPAFAGATERFEGATEEMLLRRGHCLSRRLGACAITLVDVVDHERLKSAEMVGPRRVRNFLPSTNTARPAASPVPGSEMPILAVLGFAGAVDDAAHHPRR